jgi:hypothetical protein
MPSDNVPTTIVPDAIGSPGVGVDCSRDDHVHAIAAGTPSTIGTSNSEGTSSAFARADHVHDRGDALTTGATGVVGKLVLQGGSQTLTKDGSNNATSSISPTKSLMALSVSAVGACAYNSSSVSPYIETSGAAHGQILILRNEHASNITMSSLAGSGVKLSGGGGLTLGAKDYVIFIFNSSTTTWDQLTHVMNIT